QCWDKSDQYESKASTDANAMGNGSTQPTSCGYRSLALPSHACSQSSTSGVTTSQSPNTDGIAFATSTTGCKRVWRDVLGIAQNFDIPPHLTPIFFFRSCVMRTLLPVSTFFFATDPVRVL